MQMSQEEYQKIKERLEMEKKDAFRAVEELFDGDMRESLAELSLADNHPADIGTEVYLRSQDVARYDKLLHRISTIDKAIERWKQGQYGICEHCGGDIPTERLEIIPYTTVCAECSRKEEEEEQHSFHREPVENEILNRPFSRTFNDHTGKAGFDGEDAWQAVARYGTSETLQDLGTNRDIKNANQLYE